ncbi:MAG: hypothetical protein ABI970_25220 [Chloroflexota bacterium]
MARKKFEFWLNDQRQEDWQVYELIGKLKKPVKGQGQFTRAIREGLRLWASLREGQVDVLLELFPWVREALAKSMPVPTVSGVEGGQLDEIKGMLEMLTAQQTGSGYLLKSTGGSAKPLPAPPIVEIKQVSAVSADTIADNFLSMFQ